jgi:hypothetical protein
MSFWVLVAVFSFGNIVEVDLYSTKAKCDEWALWLEDKGAKARCELVTVKE